MRNNDADLVYLPETPDDSAELDVKLAEAHYNRAIGYLKIGQLELATQATLAALEVSPDHAPTHALLEPLKQEYFIRGLTLLKENRTDQAVHALQCAVAIDPAFIDARCELGKIYLKQGELEMAKQQCDEALKSAPNSLPARNLLKQIKAANNILPRFSTERQNSSENAITIGPEIGRASLEQLDTTTRATEQAETPAYAGAVAPDTSEPGVLPLFAESRSGYAGAVAPDTGEPEYNDMISEQDGYYPSHSWYEEYDLLDGLEGVEHCFSDYENDDYYEGYYDDYSYSDMISEQDGYYPSYSWYEEYDLLDRLEGVEHCFSDYENDDYYEGYYDDYY